MVTKLRHNGCYVISGAAGLIGKAIVKDIIARGGTVMAIDVNANGLDELSAQFPSDLLSAHVMDSADTEQLSIAFDSAEKKLGKITGAVHAAYPRSEEWGAKFGTLKKEHLETDLTNQMGGAILFSQAIIDRFCENGGGALVHISSIQGAFAPKFEHYEGTKMSSPIEYSAIKAGVINMTRYLAKLYGPQKIRVNCVSPGGILAGQSKQFLDKYNNSCFTKGMLEPEDITGAVAFLLSSDSRYINGQNIIVDDGWSL